MISFLIAETLLHNYLNTKTTLTNIAVVIVTDDDAAFPATVLALSYRSVTGFSLSCHGFNSFPKMSSMKPPTMPQACFCISDVTWV